MKVEFVYFQSAISAPGIFPSDTTLNEGKYPGAEMEYPSKDFPGCLVVKHKGKTVAVPLGNVKNMVFA